MPLLKEQEVLAVVAEEVNTYSRQWVQTLKSDKGRAQDKMVKRLYFGGGWLHD